MKYQPASKIILSCAFALIAGCASKVTKYNYPADSDPTRVVNDLKKDLQAQRMEQAPVFAKDSFNEAQEHLNNAQNMLGKGNKPEKILDEAGLAKAYLDKAEVETEKNKPQLNGIAEARGLAVEAGAKQYESKNLKETDSDFASYVDKVNKGKGTPEKTAMFQQKYSDMELSAITQDELTPASQWIDQATDLGAAKRTPQTLGNAKEDYNNARLVISTDRYNDEAIDAAVAKSEASSSRLLEVVKEAKKSDIPENVAVDIVDKRHAIANLNRRVGETRVANAELRSDNAKFARDARINQMIDDAQASFDKKDAVVYRQGDNLLIRLKTVQFSSGKSDIPSRAMAVLGQTKGVITDLRATHIVVQGHTDSTGSAALNKRLSQARAEAVAKYLSTDGAVDSALIEAVGYGDTQPLTSNKTAAGRAQNRRVDVVVTPGLQESKLSQR